MGQSQSSTAGSINRHFRTTFTSNNRQEKPAVGRKRNGGSPVAKVCIAKFSRRRHSSPRHRNSILNLVKSKTGSDEADSRVDANEGGEAAEMDIPESSGHRSAWRRSIGYVKSRRWYKTADIKEDDTAERGSFSRSNVIQPIAVSSTLSPNSSSSASRSELPSETSEPSSETTILGSTDLSTLSVQTDPARDRTTEAPVGSVANPSAQVLSILDSETEILDPIGSTAAVSADDSISVVSTRPNVVLDAAATLSPTSTESTTTPTAGPNATPPAPTLPTRQQFPPAGTLVVVQGVVHTTDVPIITQTPPAEMQNSNTNYSSDIEPRISQDNSRASRRASLSGPRDRLSALLRRSHDSRPGSAASVRNSISNDTSIDLRGSEDLNSSPALEEESILPTAHQTPLTTPPATPPLLLNQTDNSSGTISSSSIDVLGTLLSVAAAATAASLLTGTSGPAGIPSPSSAPIDRPSSSPTASPSSIATNTPSMTFSPSQTVTSTSSTPISSPTLSSSSPAHIGTAGDRDRAERMRQVWTTVRNRLGLGLGQARNGLDSRSAIPVDDGIPEGASAGPLADARDARERMLNEIARAFNLGLSSSPSAPVVSPINDTVDVPQESHAGQVAEGETDTGLPLEGSFERFLVDLQIDLRGVLTGGGAVRPPQEPTIQENDTTHTSASSEASLQPHNHEAEVSDSDNDSDIESIDDRLPSHTPATNEPTQNESTNPTNTRQRINYWRLYRFPPIAAPRAHAAAESVAQNMRSGLGGLTRVSPTAASLTTNESETGASVAPSSLSSPEPQNPTIVNAAGNATVVVPVIVVGLQSVNAVWAPELAPVPPTAGPANEQISQANVEGGSRWPNRAASALRNLRRQSTPTPITSSLFQDPVNPALSTQGIATGPTNQGAQTQLPGTAQAPQNRGVPIPMPLPEILNAPGSRTFLIYVIGGYYPPDHEIVTGTGESGILDSFEALLSLHELLNQTPVLPPTVSKDQLERSGLEVIQASQMQEWEKAEKVQSNCIERCLICLDEYETEDSVRVLGCKHAFHMDCVDRWLLEGRNSCPACRGKGVSEGETQLS